jgi:hypothetical protein
MPRLKPEQRPEVIQLYRTGTHATELGKQFGVSNVTIINVLKAAGVPRRHDTRRQFPVRHDAFSTLNAESAYWLGFLMADGCVRGNAITVVLKESDWGHLDKLRQFLGCPDKPIVYQPAVQAYRFKVNSPQVVADLARHGVVPRKTWCAKASAEASSWPSFWLGVIDGDGCVSWDKAKGLLDLSVAGTEALMVQLAEFMVSTGIYKRQPRLTKRETISTLRVYGKKSVMLLTTLYSVSTTKLERKYAKFIALST